MSLTTYHKFEHDGKTYRFVYDEHYIVERQCGSNRECHCKDTETEILLPGETESKTMTEREICQFFYEQECKKLDDGDWVALGLIVTEKCKGLSDSGSHCPGCAVTVEVDSVWGIVIENSTKVAEEYAKETM